MFVSSDVLSKDKATYEILTRHLNKGRAAQDKPGGHIDVELAFGGLGPYLGNFCIRVQWFLVVSVEVIFSLLYVLSYPVVVHIYLRVAWCHS